jgi:CrcB protein
MNIILAVAAGGAIGAVGRFLLGRSMMKLLGPSFPYGTLTVNILGSFLIGLLVAALAAKFADVPQWQAFLVVGILGGFTTFSTFTLEIGLMLQRNEFTTAAIYTAASLGIGVIALFAGLWLGKSFI